MGMYNKRFLAYKMKENRLKKKLSYFDAAEDMGLGHLEYKSIENVCHIPTVLQLIKIIKTLDIDLEERLKTQERFDSYHELKDILKNYDAEKLRTLLLTINAAIEMEDKPIIQGRFYLE